MLTVELEDFADPRDLPELDAAITNSRHIGPPVRKTAEPHHGYVLNMPATNLAPVVPATIHPRQCGVRPSAEHGPAPTTGTATHAREFRASGLLQLRRLLSTGDATRAQTLLQPPRSRIFLRRPEFSEMEFRPAPGEWCARFHAGPPRRSMPSALRKHSILPAGATPTRCCTSGSAPPGGAKTIAVPVHKTAASAPDAACA